MTRVSRALGGRGPESIHGLIQAVAADREAVEVQLSGAPRAVNAACRCLDGGELAEYAAGTETEGGY